MHLEKVSDEYKALFKYSPRDAKGNVYLVLLVRFASISTSTH